LKYGTNKKASVILFDVNETLLDMTPVKKKVNNILDSKRGFRIWFGMLLQYSLVDNSTSNYHDFATIASATLYMAAVVLGEEIEEDEKQVVLALMKQLKAHHSVKKGLQLKKRRLPFGYFNQLAYTNAYCTI
jgi:2-haloacid dehalogenase